MDDPQWPALPRQALLDVDPRDVRARLKAHGAVHLRGFRDTAAQFTAFTQRFVREFVVHQRAERRPVSADGTTQTVTSGQAAIPLHRERSYLPVAPDLLFFLCVTPAADGGETLVCDGIALARALPVDLRRRLEAAPLRSITWSRTAEWGRSLGTTDRRAAVADLRRLLRYRDPACTDLEWGFEGDRLMLAFTAPWFREVAGAPCLANFLLYFLFRDEGFADQLQLSWADTGEAIPVDVGLQIARCAAPITHPIRWNAGDLLIVDNTRMMHGRRAFADVRREIHVRMGYSSIH